LADLNYTFECDRLIELCDNTLSNNKPPDNNLASELVEKSFHFKPITIKIIVFLWLRQLSLVDDPLDFVFHLSQVSSNFQYFYKKTWYKHVFALTYVVQVLSLAMKLIFARCFFLVAAFSFRSGREKTQLQHVS